MYRKDALQIQLPPLKSMDLFKIKVEAKKNEAIIPINIAFNKKSPNKNYKKV